MVRNVKKIGILTIIMLLSLGILNLSSVMAATTTLTASNATVKSGEKFSVTVKSSIKLTGWTISLSDNGGCTFSTASGGELTGSSIFGTALNGEKSLAKYTFVAPTVTKETKYTIKFTGTAMCDIDTNEVDNNTCRAIITVQPTTTKKDETTTNKKDESSSNKDTTKKSNNANLSTLGVTPKDYDFSGFSKNKTEYSVTVPKNVDSLKVVYKTADSKATVKVSGNSGFEVGSNNKITVKVTAEDGKTTKTYTIKVTQLAEEEEKPGNLIDKEEELYLKSLSIEGVELTPEFAKDTYSYTATLSDTSINELHVSAEANNEKAKIEISGNTNLVEGDNTINILLTIDDSSTQKIYQIVVNKELGDVPAVTTSENGSSSNDLIGKIKNYAGIAIVVIVLVIVAIIVLIIMLIKENKKMKEEDDEYEINDKPAEEYNVYKNDENEFKNSEMSKDNFIESLYKQRNGNFDDEDLTQQEKETLDEISKQTEKIFEEKVEGQSVEYTSNDDLEDPLEIRKNRRGKGKHSL